MTTQINPNSISGKAISRGMSPKQASQLPINLDFTTDTILLLNLNLQQGIRNVGGISGIQSVFIDNSNNSANVSITLDNGQIIVCPPFSQAIFPVFFSGQQLNFKATSTGAVLVPIIFLNTREQAQLWSTRVPIAGSVNVSGSQVFTQPAGGVFTDASGMLAVGGAAQLLVAVNGARQLLQIRNPATPASQGIAGVEPIYLGFSDAAVTVGKEGSWEVLPGESLPQFLMTTTEAIYWVAATAGHLLTAKTM